MFLTSLNNHVSVLATQHFPMPLRYSSFRMSSAGTILAVVYILQTSMHCWSISKMFTSCSSTNQAEVYLTHAYRYRSNLRSSMPVVFLDLYRLIRPSHHNRHRVSSSIRCTKEEGLSIRMTWNSRCQLLLRHRQLPRCLLLPLRRLLRRKPYWLHPFPLTHHPAV